MSFLGLVSCTIGPDYHRPSLKIPQKWLTVGGLSAENKTVVEWWTHFNDPLLNDLLQRVVKQNFDLKGAEQAVIQSQALLNKSRADLWPTFSGSAAFSLNKTSMSYETVNDPLYHLYAAQINASWEIDVFGRLRRLKEAAQADLQAQAEECYGVFLSLLATTAESYIQLRGAQQQLIMVEALQNKARALYAIAVDKKTHGLTDQRALDRAQKICLGYEAQARPLRAAIQNYIHALSLLVSEEPGALTDLLKAPGEIPYMSPEIFVGLPSQVVERRPDVRKAEMMLASSTSKIGAAKSQWFPVFSLVGASIGYQSIKERDIVSPQNLFYSVGPTFTWTVFDFGRIKAQVLASEAARDQYQFAYMQAVLKALSEVESGLVSYAQDIKRGEDIAVSKQTMARTAEVIESRYNAGLDSDVERLEAGIALLNASLEEVMARQTLALDVVRLYKALGGGWEVYAQHSQKVSKSKIST